MHTKLDAVVFAGGVISGSLARESGETIKGLIEFGSKACITRVVEGLLDCPRIGRVAVVGAECMKLRLLLNDRVFFEIERRGAIENILAGIDRLGLRGTDSPILACPGDLPLLTSESISALIEACPSSAGIGISLVPRSAIQSEQPGANYTFLRSRDGHFSNACPVVIRAFLVDRFREFLEEFHRSRKSQISIACRVGLVTAVRFALGRLSIQEAAALGQRLFGTEVHIDPNGSPALSMDVDGAPEFTYLRQRWSELTASALPATVGRSVRT